MKDEDLDLLVTRLLEGDGDALGPVREACERDAVFRERVVREVLLHRATAVVVERAEERSRFAAEVIARVKSDPAERMLVVLPNVERRRRFPSQAVVLAAAAVVMLGLLVWFFQGSATGVTLSRGESLVWSAEGGEVSTGDALSRGRVLDLESGLAELSFPAGVSVVLEGPARLTVTGEKSAYLDHGRLVARVTRREGRGFVIDGPKGRVVDLGTAFGVSVGNAGDMEVHVLEGRVNAFSHDSRKPLASLQENEALRFEDGAASRISADEGAFVTDLPPAPGIAPGYVRWSFDELDGDRLINTGRGLAEDRADSRLMVADRQAESARRVGGRFGGALAFDGVDDFAESGFEGISGQSPRTVSLWARIPADLKPTESYAMVAWGNVRGQGSAWQISINPEADEGPLGALRAGTGKAAVVGSTDLRDGMWHHLTVVMYGGVAASTATHVLLYVDGRLESTTRKSVRFINTEPSPDPHGIWLGRNLSQYDPSPPSASFFRGELDEVHVFSAALDQSMIRRVMGGSFSTP